MKKARFNFLFFIIIIGFSLVCLKAFLVQIADNKKYKQEYVKAIEPSIDLQGKRGYIYDCNNKTVALDIPKFELFVDPKFYLEYNKLNNASFINFVNSNFHVDIKSIIEKNKDIRYIKIGFIKTKDVNWVKDKLPKGFGLIKNYDRFYPYANNISQIVGFCGNNKHGLEGLEKEYDIYLTGQNTKQKVKITPYGNFEFSKKPLDGDNLHLTINEDIQNYLHFLLKETLKERQAKMVIGIIAKTNGAIIAMDSVPSYDNNKFYDYNYGHIRINPINYLFEPGSVFKIVTMSSALDSNTFTGNETLFCENGKWKFSGHVISDVEKNSDLPFYKVFAYSSNICSAKIALKENKEIFYKYLWAFGFGKKTGIDLPGEADGIVKDYVNLKPFDLATMAFGQGIGVSAIQIVRAYLAIANGGYLVNPYIVDYICKDRKILYKHKEVKKQILSPQTVEKVKQILKLVVEEGTGTNAQLKYYAIGGKTGTAQVASHKGGYSLNDYTGSFVGIFPIDKPQFVILVTVFDPKGVNYGGEVAAPVVAKLISMLAAYYKIEGDGNVIGRN
ncbi:MAG: peptidoglycan D,D-transpeptidase FtsI family protein [Desulfurella sp.]